MKQFNLTILFTMFVSMLSTKAFAYNIEAKNEDGVTIYYDYINDATELEVTSSGSGSYSGDIKIPATVTVQNTTLKVTSIGGSAFHYCTNLTSVTIPASITSVIGSGTFSVFRGF